MSDQYDIKYGESGLKDSLLEELYIKTEEIIYTVYLNSKNNTTWVEVASSKDGPTVVNQIKPEK
jgi:hypothetical protein